MQLLQFVTHPQLCWISGECSGVWRGRSKQLCETGDLGREELQLAAKPTHPAAFAVMVILR